MISNRCGIETIIAAGWDECGGQGGVENKGLGHLGELAALFFLCQDDDGLAATVICNMAGQLALEHDSRGVDLGCEVRQVSSIPVLEAACFYDLSQESV